MKTYVVPEVIKLLCDVQDIALSPPFSESWEWVGQCDHTNKNELLQHSKTDVDLSFFFFIWLIFQWLVLQNSLLQAKRYFVSVS